MKHFLIMRNVMLSHSNPYKMKTRKIPERTHQHGMTAVPGSNRNLK